MLKVENGLKILRRKIHGIDNWQSNYNIYKECNITTRNINVNNKMRL